MSPPPHGVDDAQRLEMISIIMDYLMVLMNLDDEVYTLASQAAHIARGGPIQTFAQYYLLDNILALPLMHDDIKLIFDKRLHNLDNQLHNLRK